MSNEDFKSGVSVGLSIAAIFISVVTLSIALGSGHISLPDVGYHHQETAKAKLTMPCVDEIKGEFRGDCQMTYTLDNVEVSSNSSQVSYENIDTGYYVWIGKTAVHFKPDKLRADLVSKPSV